MLRQLPDGTIVVEGREAGESYTPGFTTQENVFLQAQSPREIAANKAVETQQKKAEVAAVQKQVVVAKKVEAARQKSAADIMIDRYIADMRRIAQQNKLFGGLLDGRNGFDQNNAELENYNPTMGCNLRGFGLEEAMPARVAGDADFGQKITVAIPSLVPIQNVSEDYGYPAITGLVVNAQRAIQRSSQTRKAVGQKAGIAPAPKPVTVTPKQAPVPGLKAAPAAKPQLSLTSGATTAPTGSQLAKNAMMMRQAPQAKPAAPQARPALPAPKSAAIPARPPQLALTSGATTAPAGSQLAKNAMMMQPAPQKAGVRR